MWEERLSKISCCCPLTNGAPATNAPLVIQVTNGAPPANAPLVTLVTNGAPASGAPLVVLQKKRIKKNSVLAHSMSGAALLVRTSNGALQPDAPFVYM